MPSDAPGSFGPDKVPETRKNATPHKLTHTSHTSSYAWRRQFQRSRWYFPTIIFALLVGLIGWWLFTFFANMSACNPNAPWFCTETTLSNRMIVLGMTVVAGSLLTVWLWFLPLRTYLLIPLSVAVFAVGMYASMSVANVDIRGCKQSVNMEYVEGC